MGKGCVMVGSTGAGNVANGGGGGGGSGRLPVLGAGERLRSMASETDA